jgi:predicted nucleotidyltransferase
MQLDDNFTLKGKKYEWVLEYEKNTGEVKEDGKPIIKRGKWYYPKLEQVLKKYTQEAVRPLESITEILNKLEEINKKIESIPR